MYPGRRGRKVENGGKRLKALEMEKVELVEIEIMKSVMRK